MCKLNGFKSLIEAGKRVTIECDCSYLSESTRSDCLEGFDVEVWTAPPSRIAKGGVSVCETRRGRAPNELLQASLPTPLCRRPATRNGRRRRPGQN